MQRIENEHPDTSKVDRAKRRSRTQRVQSFLLNFVTFGLAIVVIIASFRASAPDDPEVEESAVTHEQPAAPGGDLS